MRVILSFAAPAAIRKHQTGLGCALFRKVTEDHFVLARIIPLMITCRTTLGSLRMNGCDMC